MEGGPDVAGMVEDDAIVIITEGEVVCGTCGSGSAPHLIVNCARCNAYEHWYYFIFVPCLVFPLTFSLAKHFENCTYTSGYLPRSNRLEK
uniref:Uncharacterized protein n=1 Tax=Arundo donax TaxID=35708 RepID=A0A0A9D685_ARUDO